IVASSSSLVISRPACSTRCRKTAKALGVSSRRRSPHHAHSFSASMRTAGERSGCVRLMAFPHWCWGILSELCQGGPGRQQPRLEEMVRHLCRHSNPRVDAFEEESSTRLSALACVDISDAHREGGQARGSITARCQLSICHLCPCRRIPYTRR